MSSLVVRDRLLLVLAQHPALPLQARNDPLDRAVKVLLRDILASASGRPQRRLVTHIGNVRTREPGRQERKLLRDRLERDLLADDDRLEVDAEDLAPTADVRSIDRDVSVESSGTHQRAVEHIRPVRSRKHDDMLVGSETVHLHEELVERRLALIVSAKVAALATRFTDGVDLIDEDDARSVLLRVCEQISYSRGTDSDEHLDELGSGNGQERHAGFTGGRLGQQRLTGTGGSGLA